ncbi:MAG: M15 family metallopeptidase [Halioglobus sp.]
MLVALSDRQLTGLDESHLVRLPSGHRLHGAVADAFAALKHDAKQAGFKLAIASSYRSFTRQLAIWNGKACGERPVYDDAGEALHIASLQPEEQLQAIMRFSAVPGGSRHHWGTDLDVYDAAALPEGYELQLSVAEVAPGGMFDPLHRWLDERMAAGKSRGFYRPYAMDRGGIAAERWHLSYAPIARPCEQGFRMELLKHAWDEAASGQGVLLRDVLERQLPEVFDRYIAVPDGWCPL